MSDSVGRHIKLFLVDGVPGGTLTAEIMNWTGHVLYAPRSRIVEILRRPEVKRTGIYLLIGEDPTDSEGMLVYVGQGDDVGRRLAHHNKDPDKEFWESVCVVTSKDLNLTAAHVRYLESRMITLIRKEGRANLKNLTEPAFDRLPEADTSDMEDFVARLQVLLPVLGIEFVRPTPRPSEPSNEQALSYSPEQADFPNTADGRVTSPIQGRQAVDGERSPVFKFSSASVKAKAVEIGDQMIVLKGSQAQLSEQPSLGSNVRTYREQLKRSGKLVPAKIVGLLEFTDDVAFTSPSAAAEGVMGTSRNGRIDWVVEDTGQTYADWQETEIKKAIARPY